MMMPKGKASYPAGSSAVELERAPLAMAMKEIDQCGKVLEEEGQRKGTNQPDLMFSRI
jgi:hypothetical protein